jgi:hypothetical protein
MDYRERESLKFGPLWWTLLMIVKYFNWIDCEFNDNHRKGRKKKNLFSLIRSERDIEGEFNPNDENEKNSLKKKLLPL